MHPTLGSTEMIFIVHFHHVLNIAVIFFGVGFQVFLEAHYIGILLFNKIEHLVTVGTRMFYVTVGFIEA